MKKIITILLLAVLAVTVCACGDDSVDISQPESINAVDGTDAAGVNSGAVEDSFNVNGKRFTLTLYDFTSQYNARKQQRGDAEMFHMDGWKKNGQVTKDNNGVKIQYYYYDDDGASLTATVEADTDKLVNVGVGTTNDAFTSKSDGKNKSDAILLKAAMAAQVACRYDNDSLNTLQTIFYKLATGNDKSLYHDGFVFNFTTKENSADSSKLMMFRVFPITEELREEWKLPEY